MKREEIEQLLADYLKGEISASNKLIVENLLANDPALKHEADEMLALWQMMDNKVIDENNDEQFYNMLQAEKQNDRPNVISLNKAWFYATAAAACIIIFFAGRFTTAPVEVIKYKTLIVKQQVPVQEQPAMVQTVQSVFRKHVDQVKVKDKFETKIEAPSVLAQQLRSVYASERIAAITALSDEEIKNESSLKMLQLALMEDPNTNVRLTILNSLRPLIAQTNVQDVLINALSQQDAVFIQTSIIGMLGDAKIKRAIPQMISLLDNKNINASVQDKIKDEIKQFMY